ncbi:MAG TPA: polymer-forming cytoskeletal protein [Spirochaetota bacterium]|nr:polymer-forming cytoskeletal protein [Spirochaetota bacterium]HPH02170.1 polymer-forming cytoskeletal protein [Spirochaetota bacterium]
MAVISKGEITNSIIGEKSFFEGRFMVKGALRVDGKFEGDALEVDQLFIGQTGRIKTNINAVNVVVEGLVIGNIKASTRVMLLPTARILGDIRTPELIIQNGVILEGRCIISNDLNQSARTLIENLYASTD